LRVSLYTVATVFSLLSCSNASPPSGKDSANTTDPQHLIGQSLASDQTYFLSGGKLLCNTKEGATVTIPGIDTEESFFFQSGDKLITGDLHLPREITIIDGTEPVTGLSMNELSIVGDIELDPNSGNLFWAGNNGKSYTFLITDQKGKVLHQKEYPYKNKTTLVDDNIIHTAILDGDWVVWLPGNLELIVFDNHLDTKKSAEISIPEEILTFPDTPFSLLDEPSPEIRRSECEKLIGTPVHVSPSSAMVLNDHFVITYWVFSLSDCKRLSDPEQTTRPFDTAFSSKMFHIELDNFEIVETRMLENLLVDGLYGHNKLASRRLKEDESWHNEIVAWN